MFYIEDYTKKRFPVRCSSGHIVDASDGRRLQFMLENGCYIFDAGYTQAFDRSDYKKLFYLRVHYPERNSGVPPAFCLPSQ